MSSHNFFMMIKPDGVNRGLVGKILKRFEERGFHILQMKMCKPSAELVHSHYAEHQNKTFFDELVNFTTSGKVVAMIINGNIDVARKIVGNTRPWDAKTGTIRGDYSCSLPQNLIHCSDSIESAKREIELWF